ncbi:MAG: hypothetical protein DMG31_19505 [Acidobacteria bacterium]|nr:MAG: hypothetical protein DMG31_19505 [Acidobacteriota bacterium]
MTQTENTILKDTQRGAAVEADGNAPTQSVQPGPGISLALDSQNDPQALGPNNERLEQVAPRLVNALRELVVQFRQEGIVARRHEIRRIRQARLFWQGLQYAWWNPQDMNWHLPWEAKIYDDSALQDMPRYQFVTNLYQAFGLSFVSVISQDVPATRFYPQSTLNEADIETAKAASQVADLVEQNNRVQQLLTSVGFYLWTDGKIGGYVRYVADGQRFGWRDELVLEERWVRLGGDAYVCPQCGAEIDVGDEGGGGAAATEKSPGSLAPSLLTPHSRLGVSAPWAANAEQNRRRDSSALRTGPQNDSAGQGPPGFLTGTICPQCGARLGANDFRPAPLVPVPQTVGTRRVANGQEVISIVGGLELNTPVWANEQHEFPYLQWQMEVHRAKLKAAFPHAADKIQMGGPQAADDIYARATRIAVSQGMPTIHPGDALFNLITFSRTWMRPWAFYSIEDAAVRDQLLRLFPDGCYVAFAGETYCESRNESMEDCWRVMHALPGDGQNRPSVGDSLIDVQERYNTLSNMQAETYEYGIPPIYAASAAGHVASSAGPDRADRAISHRTFSGRLRRGNGKRKNRKRLCHGSRPGARAAGTGVAAAENVLLRFDAAGGRLLPQEPAGRRGDSVSRRGRRIRGAIHPPGEPEGQYSVASGIRRDFPAPEIAATRRSAAAHGQSRSHHSSRAARAGQSRVHQVAGRLE